MIRSDHFQNETYRPFRNDVTEAHLFRSVLPSFICQTVVVCTGII